MAADLGNRGRCAQPCRLPYKLIEEKGINKKEEVIDKGYLISPRDLCALDYIPSLINAGVKCFKIEGRLKSPEYVATVTRIYRKYIDMVLNEDEYIVDEKDILELKQIFNRGGFSSGHLSNKSNHDLIFKEKPNNMGLYVGNVAGYNKQKGHIKLLLNENLAIGDTINFENENTKYTISELMINNLNVPSARTGSTVTIGRMKGNIKLGDKIYKLSSKSQLDKAQESYASENKKLPLICNLSIKKGKPIIMDVHLQDLEFSLYKHIGVKIQSNLIPDKALKSPITKERIIAQVTKTKDTPFEFKEINLDLEDDVFIPSIKEFNEIRRMALIKLENIIISKNKRISHLTENDINYLLKEFLDINASKVLLANKKNIAVYFNIIHPNFDYNKLDDENISCVYIPLRYFMRKDCNIALKTITAKFKTYIYMPAIIKANYKNIIKHGLEDLLEIYNIGGFVISSLGDFVLLENYKDKYDFIGNFTLNVFNIYTISTLQKLGLSKITLSPESNLDNIKEVYELEKAKMPLELIVYGNTPVMKMNYCLLGKANKCYPECQMRCTSSNKYFLRDRLGFEFRILPDNIQTVTTIFNSRTTSIQHIDTNINSLRIDLLDESIDEINYIVKSVLDGTQLEGKKYTYGNLNRDV